LSTWLYIYKKPIGVSKLLAWWIFYRKILFASLYIIVALFMIGKGLGASSYSAIALSYTIISPFAHLYLYEIDKPNEYYFYANLGLHKLLLWSFTLIVSFTFLLLAWMS
jgi:hypothetical protein